MVTVPKDVTAEERRAAHNASSRRSYAKYVYFAVPCCIDHRHSVETEA